MRKKYDTPEMEIEKFTVDCSIATSTAEYTEPIPDTEF